MRCKRTTPDEVIHGLRINLLRERLKRLLCFRECADRWAVYQHFPPLLVLTSTSRQSEHWQRCAGEAALQLQVVPLLGAITCLPVERDAGSSNLWRLAWKTLSTTVPCRLQDLLLPLPAEAALPGLLTQPMAETHEAVPPVDAACSPACRWSRIISGHFMERASSVEQVTFENAGRSNGEERAALAFLGLCMDRRHLELLDLLLAHPLLDVPEMATLLELESSSMERYVRALRNHGSLEPVATRVGQRWRLSGQGLHLVAAMHHVSMQSIATSAEPTGDNEEVTLVQRGLDVLLRHREHTVGVYSFFASLCRVARHEQVRPGEHRLLWWETGTVCERRYRDHDRWHNLRPDAMGEYQAGEQRVRFWLEWDRATMGTRDLVAKFSTYAHYVASREWYREPGGLPLLLVVAPAKAQERRIARIASVLLRETPALAIATTTATRLAEQGPIAAIWYRVPTTDQQTDMLPRSRWYNASSPR
jgi:hypothetical protein